MYMTAFDRWCDLWQCRCLKGDSMQTADFLPCHKLTPTTQLVHWCCLSWLICVSIHHQPAGPTLASLQNKPEYATKPRLTCIFFVTNSFFILWLTKKKGWHVLTVLHHNRLVKKNRNTQKNVTAVDYCGGLECFPPFLSHQRLFWYLHHFYGGSKVQSETFHH